jgi:hypothetical protein
MNVTQVSAEALSGGQSVKVATSTTSAQGPVIVQPTTLPKGVPVKCLVTCDVLTFGRKGSNPTAVSDGTDQVFAANVPYRVELMEGERMAFIVPASTGNVYFTPGA